MGITVTRSALEIMLAQARVAHPRECCGLLLGARSGRVEVARPTANIAPNPMLHFEIDPQALVDAHRAQRAGGPLLLGYYHSHPTGHGSPSATDRAQASGDGRLWAIIAGRALTLWRDGAEGFAQLAYAVDEGQGGR